jgi:transcriptional regulator with XRE-family HTH domain
MPLANTFKSILSNLRLTQKEFADKTALPYNSIAKICSGRRPRLDTLDIILDHLPAVHQGELLTAWLSDSIPDQHRDRFQFKFIDDGLEINDLVADTPTALAERDSIFKDLCLQTRLAVMRLKKACHKDPEMASRLRAFADEQM